jgi:superfamily I DNA/RNA helicase
VQETRKFDVHLGSRLTYQRPGDWPQPLTEDVIVGGLTEWARDTKRAYWKRGLLSFSDVLWVAYRVLQLHSQLAKAVAARFDELIVDEVQDTGELQLKCVEFLRTQETHPRLVIVGDLCQAVYEWSGATPAGLRQFAADQQLQELPLTANYRSSELICKVTYRFSTRSKPDRAEARMRTRSSNLSCGAGRRTSSPSSLSASASVSPRSASPRSRRQCSRGLRAWQ